LKEKTPKTWRTLANKPADIIVKKLGLSDFSL
jgi:hypothetical protein